MAGRNWGSSKFGGTQFGELRDEIREIGRFGGWNSANWTFAGTQFGEFDVSRGAIREIGRLTLGFGFFDFWIFGF